MSPLLLLTLGAVLGNNLALTQLLDAPPPIALARKLALITASIVVVAVPCSWLLERFLLIPYELAWLESCVFSAVVAVIASVTALLVQQHAPVPPGLRNSLLPLLISNGIVSGAALRGAGTSMTFGTMLFQSAAVAGGFALLLLMLAALQQRLKACDIPAPFQGPAILLITGGMIALALMGLTGLA